MIIYENKGPGSTFIVAELCSGSNKHFDMSSVLISINISACLDGYATESMSTHLRIAILHSCFYHTFKHGFLMFKTTHRPTVGLFKLTSLISMLNLIPH